MATHFSILRVFSRIMENLVFFRGAWRATVHGVTESWTQFDTHTHTHTHTHENNRASLVAHREILCTLYLVSSMVAF